MPPWLVEVLVGTLLPVALIGLRLALVPFAHDRAPYAFVFLGLVAAAVLAGWRSGLLALVIGQGLVWYLVVEPRWSFVLPDAERAAGLVLATVCEVFVLAIIILYQREVDRAWVVREGHLDLLEKALREIDHRTSNNYQTVLALIHAQAKASDGPVREALERVAGRIRAIADAQRKLGLSSVSLEQVLIADHLGELCAGLERGLAASGVAVECDIAEIEVGTDESVYLSILVNELVTNALKHAFPDGREGTIRIGLKAEGKTLALSVADDGVGLDGSAATKGTGLGTRLVDTFVRQLGGTHKVESDATGTRHRVELPARPARARRQPAAA